jgi:hypothetical protein
MAQVWPSFDEIRQVFGCDTADARMRVVANQWERRRCTDGLVRAQVPSDVHGAKEEARRDGLAARLELSKKYERKIKRVRREIGLSALERHSNKLGDRRYDLDGRILNTPATSRPFAAKLSIGPRGSRASGASRLRSERGDRGARSTRCGRIGSGPTSSPRRGAGHACPAQPAGMYLNTSK